MKVLFIGNSHTFVHYVPLRVMEYAKKKRRKIEATMLTHPGMGLDWHLEQSQTYFNVIYGNYDAIVLQHNAHPFPGKKSLVSSGKKLISLVPEKTKVYLYMTWSEKNNPKGQKKMSDAYEQLAKDTGALICPVGKIWWQVREAHPEEELYFADGEHTSLLGASLSAVVIARTLLGMDTDPKRCYEEAKKLEKMKQDPRMIDLAYKDGQLLMK